MQFRLFILSALLLATVLAVPAAADDVVWLKNGDRITGQIIKKDGDNLVVKPKFGGGLASPAGHNYQNSDYVRSWLAIQGLDWIRRAVLLGQLTSPANWVE